MYKNQPTQSYNKFYMKSTKQGCVFACIGRALEWHSRGQEFDPLRLHQKSRSRERAGFFTFTSSLFTFHSPLLKSGFSESKK